MARVFIVVRWLFAVFRERALPDRRGPPNAPSRWGETPWAVPFVVLALIVLVLARPWPVFPPPAHYRVVVDATGREVRVPVPLRGVVSVWHWTPYFLQYSHAPDALYKAGDAHGREGFAQSLYGRIYRQVSADIPLWDVPPDLESQLAQDRDDIVHVWGADERLGMIGFASFPGGGFARDSEGGLVWDEAVTGMARAVNRLLGHEALGEELAATYRASVADLEHELQPQTLTQRPRALSLASPANNWSHLLIDARGDARAGMVDATRGWLASGRENDAERVLAMDPDLVFTLDAASFVDDPRWHGLKAVKSRRVYSSPAFGAIAPYHIDNAPLLTRWRAEIAHPERLQPRLRDLIREHYLEGYGYRLTDSEIDAMLSIDANRSSPGYERFRTGQMRQLGAVMKGGVVQ